MKTKEEIFHNKLVHYNPTKFPNGMKKCFYNAMQEYSDQQHAEFKDKLEMKTFQLKAADSDYQKQIEEKDKEIEELKRKLANNCTCTESIICEQCLSK
jgi:DNA-binding transcriptional regulator GbsR (MarR family)